MASTVDKMLEGIGGRLEEAAANTSLSKENFIQLSGDINQFIVDLSPFTLADNWTAISGIKSQLSSLGERFSMETPSQDAPLESRVEVWPPGSFTELNERLTKAENDGDTEAAKQIAQEVHDLHIGLSPFERHDSEAFLKNLKERAEGAQTASPDVDEESLVHDAEVQEVEDVETQESDDVPTWKKIGAGILILSLIAMPFLAPLGVLMGGANSNSTQVNFMNGPRGGTRTDLDPSYLNTLPHEIPNLNGTSPITQPMCGLDEAPVTYANQTLTTPTPSPTLTLPPQLQLPDAPQSIHDLGETSSSFANIPLTTPAPTSTPPLPQQLQLPDVSQPMFGLSEGPEIHTPTIGTEVALYNPASITAEQQPTFDINPSLFVQMSQTQKPVIQEPTGSEVALYGQTTQPMCGLNDMGTDLELYGAQHEGTSSALPQGYGLPTGDEPTVPYVDPALLNGDEVVPFGAKFADAPRHSSVLELPSGSETGVPLIATDSTSAETPQFDPSILFRTQPQYRFVDPSTVSKGGVVPYGVQTIDTPKPGIMSKTEKTTSDLFCKAPLRQMICKRPTEEKVCKLTPPRLQHDSLPLPQHVVDVTGESRAQNGTSNY